MIKCNTSRCPGGIPCGQARAAPPRDGRPRREPWPTRSPGAGGFGDPGDTISDSLVLRRGCMSGGWACKGISYPSGQRHFIAVIHLSTCIVLFYRWPLHHRSGALQLASPSRSPVLQPEWPPPAAAQAVSSGLSVQQVGSLGLVSQRLQIERTATDAQGAAPTHQVASHISCRSLPPTWTPQA